MTNPHSFRESPTTFQGSPDLTTSLHPPICSCSSGAGKCNDECARRDAVAVQGAQAPCGAAVEHRSQTGTEDDQPAAVVEHRNPTSTVNYGTAYVCARARGLPESAAYRIGACVAVNQALDARHGGESTRPIMASAARTVEVCEDWREAGIPFPWLCETLVAVVDAVVSSTRPTSLGYFRAAVLDRWAARAEEHAVEARLAATYARIAAMEDTP